MSLTCVACKVVLQSSTHDLLYLHPASSVCRVRVTDHHGVSLDHRFEVDTNDGQIYDLAPPREVTPREEIVAAFKAFGGEVYTSFDTAVNELFDGHGLPRLGGASGGSGWSAYQTLQRCPHLYKRKYIDRETDPYAPPVEDVKVSSPALEIGSMVHLYIACYYQRMIDAGYPLTPELCNEFFLEKGLNPESTEVSWKIFTGYRSHYANDAVRPLAVEHLAVDPRTKQSCRYDLIVEVLEHTTDYPKGVYNLDIKTASREDYVTLHGWHGNGEIIGQMDLYQRLRLDLRFGPLAGSLIGLCFKTKVPKFKRVYVPVREWQLERHRQDLNYWDASRAMYKSLGVWPRARAACTTHFGLCSEFDACSAPEEPV